MVILLPVAYIISLQGDVNLIWWSYPIAETVALIINIVFLRFIYKRIIAPMKDKELAQVRRSGEEMI